MKILISHISDDTRFFEFTVKRDRFNIPELREDVSTKVTVYRSGRDYDVNGSIRTSLELSCDRCLGSYILDINENIHVLYGSNEEAEKEENYVFISPKDTELDLLPYVRDTIRLLIPYKKLCSEDCKGLCPQCGANLNHESCSCNTKRIDPRWDTLKELKKTLENAEE